MEGGKKLQRQFTIGQMSKLYNIPVKTLRYYDEIGLFKPYEVDEKNGYRYYRIEQFKMLDTIWFLKSMGIPLKEIVKRVEHSTIDDFVSILSEYEKVNREKISELLRIQKHLTSKINELKEAKTTNGVEEPFIDFYDERKIIAFRGDFKDLVDVEQVLRKVKKKIQHVTPVMIGRVGKMISLPKIMEEDVLEFSGLFILIDDASDLDEDRITSLESGFYATLYTRKLKTEDTSDLHLMLRFIKEEGFEPTGPFIKRQIVDNFISHNEEERLAQIQIKVKRKVN